MKITGIALAMGIPSGTLETLLQQGHVPDSVATRLTVRASSLQEFVDGRANANMGLLLSSNIETVQELRDTIGREGAIGLLIGMAVRKHA